MGKTDLDEVHNKRKRKNKDTTRRREEREEREEREFNVNYTTLKNLKPLFNQCQEHPKFIFFLKFQNKGELDSLGKHYITNSLQHEIIRRRKKREREKERATR